MDRHAILSDMISDAPEAGVQLGSSPVRGRVFALVPYRRFLNAMPVSKVSRNEEDIQEAFDTALRGQVLPLASKAYIVYAAVTLDGLAGERSTSFIQPQPSSRLCLKGNIVASPMQDEGIMVKDLESRWVANDRKGAWMKLKPDHAFVSDIDAVVIGGHFGTGRRRGEIAEYLLALAEKPGLGQTRPSSFISMCRSVLTALQASNCSSNVSQIVE